MMKWFFMILLSFQFKIRQGGTLDTVQVGRLCISTLYHFKVRRLYLGKLTVFLRNEPITLSL